MAVDDKCGNGCSSSVVAAESVLVSGPLSYLPLCLLHGQNSDKLFLCGPPSSENDSVQCHTDLKLCCSNNKQGPYRGDWYFPDGKRLPLLGEMLYERRGPQRVDLRRASGNGPTGIYRCDIPTEALHNITNTSVRATVYVRLYTGSGGKCSPHL